MTRRGRQGLAACALVVAVTGCGRGAGARAARAAATIAPPPAGTRVEAASRPVLDRGSDVVAIARSLLRVGRHLEVRCPGVASVARVYAPGSPIARGMVAVCRAMRRERRHIVEIDAAPLQLTVVSRLPDVVSFRLVEHLARRELVDEQGHVLQRVGPATETYTVSMLRFSSRDPWRLNDVHRLGPRYEVRL